MIWFPVLLIVVGLTMCGLAVFGSTYYGEAGDCLSEESQ